jgi:tetratricopeptide (TPR) repeat protein
MSPDLPTEYEQLTPEEVADIDAVCDRFERAWKEVPAGGLEPCVESYVGDRQGAVHHILLEELVALERACRERYGSAAQHKTPKEPGAGAEVPEPSATIIVRGRADGAARWTADWPRIPGLELVDVLGSGGMGVVFRARQATLNRDVAVKLLRDDHRVDSGQRERFLQEALAVARLRHPHLVQVYEFGEVPARGGSASRPYLVLEYVSEGSLADLLHGSPQPPTEAARLVESIAEAIHYAHQQGIIHRDLKPANVLLQRTEGKGDAQTEVFHGQRPGAPPPLTANLCAKVTDFGLAKLLAGSDLTQSGDVLGTPSYMAPEQAAGKGTPITAAVDVYGLGAILYETLTGRPPFVAETGVATLGLVLSDEPVPPRRLQPTVPRDLETICLKCLRKEPGRRYATAQDLADDLRRFRAGEPVRARPVGTAERVVRWCRRHPGVAGLVAALVLVFLAGSAGVLWQWQKARRNAADYQRERDVALQENQRAERQLQAVRAHVDRLDRLGRDQMGRRGEFRTGQVVLEEALRFYQELLSEESSDPTVRREAANLHRHVADIYFTLGQAEKAAEAYGHQARLLATLLEEEPANQALRFALADSKRWQGNMFRDLGKTRKARTAYDEAATLQQGLLDESPDSARYQAALANTLLNRATLFSRQTQREELEQLYDRIVTLVRAAVHNAPEEPSFEEDLALALGDQGVFLLYTGRGAEAEAPIRESLEIYQKLLDGGHRKGEMERYAARAFVNLGRVLVAAGDEKNAEESYNKATQLLLRIVKDSPESAIRLADLAATQANLADFYTDRDRLLEALQYRRRAIQNYETLNADFQEDPQYRRLLVRTYLAQVSTLWQMDRQTESAELHRKAFELAPDDPNVNNELAWFLATTPEPRLRDAALAVRLARKAVDARPRSAALRNTLGVAHYRNGDNQAAVTELETSMSLRDGGDGFDWFFLAMAYWRLGERDKARTWFDRAVQEMDRYQSQDSELRRFRAEAEAVLADSDKR